MELLGTTWTACAGAINLVAAARADAWTLTAGVLNRLSATARFAPPLHAAFALHA